MSSGAAAVVPEYRHIISKNEVVLCDLDAAIVIASVHEEGSPMKQYGVAKVLPYRIRVGAIYRRHGLHRYAVEQSDTGAERLKEDLSNDPFAREAGLSPSEFLGFRCGLFVEAKRPGWEKWQREMQLVRYKLELARRSKKLETAAKLRGLYETLRDQTKGHSAMMFRDVLGKTVH